MTEAELNDVNIINGKAKERIALESGQSTESIRELVFSFKQTTIIQQWLRIKYVHVTYYYTYYIYTIYIYYRIDAVPTEYAFC